METHRLPTKEIENLFRRGRAVHTPFFSFFFRKTPSGRARIAASVSKKTEKSAVLRNRLRRRILEWFRVNTRGSRISADILVVVHKEAACSPRKKIYEELAQGLSRIIR